MQLSVRSCTTHTDCDEDKQASISLCCLLFPLLKATCLGMWMTSQHPQRW